MSKLKEKELLELLVIAVQNSIEYFVIENSEFKERIPELQQFYVQIKEIIQGRAEQEEIEVCYIDIVLDLYDQLEQKKPEVTEEWIKEKAKELMAKLIGIKAWDYMRFRQYVQDFIRSFVKEIQGK